MVVGALSLIQKGQITGHSMQFSLLQKGQTSGCSGCSTQWTQYAVDAAEKWYMVVGTLSLIQKGQTSGHSGHSTQLMQWNGGI